MARQIQDKLTRSVSRAEWTSLQRFRSEHYAAMFESPDHVAVARFVGVTGFREMRNPKPLNSGNTLWRPRLIQDVTSDGVHRGFLRSATSSASVRPHLSRLYKGMELPAAGQAVILELAADSHEYALELLDYHEQKNPKARFTAFVLSAAEVTIDALEEAGFRRKDEVQPAFVAELGEAHGGQLSIIQYDKPSAV